MNEFLTTKEAAILLKISVSSLYKYTMRKQIPFYKQSPHKILFKRTDLEEWQTRNYIEPKQ